MCETFKIKHRNSTAYRLQMNGVVEAANKNINKILRKMVDNYKKWHEKLLFALLGYRTIVRTSTGETPYLLVYGTEAVIPTEVEIPSIRIIQEAELSDAEWVRSWYEQLDLIDGKRINAVCQQKGLIEAIHIGAIDVETDLPASGRSKREERLYSQRWM
ncbi:uncharacterized protein [Nicotiana tomentosiformis]|uniref:uncharacterized protein n=1 Tax=Nicotiana tomentosiformis TaxID=4098 RepID=UPI00388C3548